MNYARIKSTKIMKNIFALAVCTLFSIVGLSSCTPDRSSQQITVQPAKIDYSNCPYVGLSGSTYERTAGSGDTYMVMMFWFDPDGTGAWGYNKSGKVEVFAFHYGLRHLGQKNKEKALKNPRKQGRNACYARKSGLFLYMDYSAQKVRTLRTT